MHLIENCVIKRNDIVGRYMVTGRDLAPSEEVFTDYPYVIGPKTCSPAVCLGCLKKVDCTSLCPKCRWPVCNEECAERAEHAGECQVFSSSKARFQRVENPNLPLPQYECVTPLRLLLKMESDKESWLENVEEMQSHCEERSQETIWNNEYVNIVQYLRLGCKLSERFSEEIIHRVCGILEVNSYEVLTEDGLGARGLYPKAAILSHSCVANTCHTIIPNEGYKMVLRTTVEIKEGEELFCSYTGSLQPTMLRRDNLQFGKYFGCNCPRCSDPMELGTNMSSIICAGCGSGIIVSTDPLDEEAYWECSECHFTAPGIGVKRMFMEIRTDIERLDRIPLGPAKIDAIEQVLEKYSGMLHENNALNAGLWYDLIQLYGKVEGYTLDVLPDELYEHKINLCRKLLALLDIIEPGYTRIRGIILYEYHTVLLMVAKMKFEYKEISLYQFKQLMLEVRRILDESVSILCLEPESCPEGKLAVRAANSLVQLTASIAMILY